MGTLDRDPAFVATLASPRRGDRPERPGRSSPGPRTGLDLDAATPRADLLVLASRGETYGMVVTEALARGLPVVATEVGGVPEALGHGADGARPGLLVSPGDAAALAAALRRWLGDAELRGRLRRPPASDARRSPAGRPPRRSVAGVLQAAAR